MKQESPPALFEFFEGDSILSEGPLRHVCSRLTMPESSLPPELLDPDVPPFIVINVRVPVHPRAIFGARRLPPTVNAIFYLRMTKDTAEQLSRCLLLLDGVAYDRARGTVSHTSFVGCVGCSVRNEKQGATVPDRL